jgi:hypothetical protein
MYGRSNRKEKAVVTPDVELASLISRVANMPGLVISPDNPVTVPPGYKVTSRTTQTSSLLQIENLSQSFTVLYFASDGAHANTGSLTVGSAPYEWNKNFNGAVIVAANVSVNNASMQVTLIDG